MFDAVSAPKRPVSAASNATSTTPITLAFAQISAARKRQQARKSEWMAFAPPAEARHWGERLQSHFARPNRPVTWRPLAYATKPGAGKLGMSYGATLVGREAMRDGSGWIAGAAVMAAASAVVLTGVILLGNTVGRVNPRAAPWLKAASIGGGLAMTAGYGVSGLASVQGSSDWAIGVGTSAKWLGTGMMAYTLPAFITHATAVLGDPPFVRHRSTVGSHLRAFGLATLAAAMSMASSSTIPAAGTQAVAVVGTLACLMAAGIIECANPPWPYNFPQAAKPVDVASLPPSSLEDVELSSMSGPSYTDGASLSRWSAAVPAPGYPDGVSAPY